MPPRTLKRPAQVKKGRSKCPCGKWVPNKHRGTRAFCLDHSAVRAHRVDDRLFNRRSGHIAVKQVPRGVRSKYPRLFAEWSRKDAGCGIVCLSQRPDVAALRRFSKTLRPLYREDLGELLKWFFVAHRQDLSLGNHFFDVTRFSVAWLLLGY